MKPAFSAQVAQRYRIDRHNGVLTITIPVKRYWLPMLFQTIWLIGVGRAVFGGADHGPQGIGLGFIAGLMVFVLCAPLWQLLGKEIIIADGSFLIYRLELFGWGYDRRYARAGICALRALPFNSWRMCFTRRGGPPFWSDMAGPVTFDYAGKPVVAIAPSLHCDDAQQVVDLLREHYPATVV